MMSVEFLLMRHVDKDEYAYSEFLVGIIYQENLLVTMSNYWKTEKLTLFFKGLKTLIVCKAFYSPNDLYNDV